MKSFNSPADIEPVEATAAPAPLGHYAQAIVHNGIVYLSGQLPLDAAAPGRIHSHSPFADQMRQLLHNCEHILKSAGSRRDRVLSMTLYLDQLAHWEAADQLVAEFFGAHRPARTVLELAALRKGFAVQADMVAALVPRPSNREAAAP